MVRFISASGISALITALISASVLSATTYNCSTVNVPGGPAFAAGYNNAGTISGYFQAGGTTHGFIQDAAGNFTTIDPPGTVQTNLYGINNNGVAVGRYYPPNTGTPIFFTATAGGTITPIAAPDPYTLTAVYGINDSGAISATVFWTANNQGNSSFVILNPDGTLTFVPGYISATGGIQNVFQPGSLNNSRQMLETNPSIGSVQGASNLADASGNLTPLQFPYPVPLQVNIPAFGLNNAGAVAGIVNLWVNPSSVSLGFVRDPSGLYSEFLCPGVPVGHALIYAINDNGVILGDSANPFVPGGQVFVATAIPGQAQVTLSQTSLSFPPQPDFTTSQPQTFTITNSGNARLDIGRISMAAETAQFNVSGCLNSSGAISLDPGASCTVSVSVTVTKQAAGNGTLVIDDSAPDAPQTVSLSVAGSTAPPSCQVSSISGMPPETATFTMQDAYSGLASIVLLSSTNANVNNPAFQSGTESPVHPTATQINPSQPASANFKVTNTAGGSTTCGTTFGGSGGPASWNSLGGSFQGKVAMATNADGRLEAFVRGSDNSVQHIIQNTADGTWGGWETLGGIITSDPAAGVNSNGAVQVFAIGTDGAVWTNVETSGGADSWAGWTSLGFAPTSDITVARNTGGDLEIFARGTDFSLWHNAQTSPGGTWSGWSSLGGYITADPSVAMNSNGTLQAFVKGGDNSVWTIAQSSPGSSTWGSWIGLGNTINGDIALAVNSDGTLEAVVRGSDSALWYDRQSSPGSSTWTGWSSVGGNLISDPSLAVNSSGALEAFGVGTDNALWHIAETSAGGPWGSWAPLGGAVSGGVTAAANTDGRVAAFVRAPDNTLWYIEQTSAGSWN